MQGENKAWEKFDLRDLVCVKKGFAGWKQRYNSTSQSSLHSKNQSFYFSSHMLNSSQIFTTQMKFVFYSCYHQKSKVSVLPAETELPLWYLYTHSMQFKTFRSVTKDSALCQQRSWWQWWFVILCGKGRQARECHAGGETAAVSGGVVKDLKHQVCDGPQDSFPFQGISFCFMIWPAIQPLPLHVLSTTLMVLLCLHTLIPLISRHSCPSPLVSPTQFIAGSFDLLSFKTLFISGMKKEFYFPHRMKKWGELCCCFCVCVYFIFIYSPHHAYLKIIWTLLPNRCFLLTRSQNLGGNFCWFIPWTLCMLSCFLSFCTVD